MYKFVCFAFLLVNSLQVQAGWLDFLKGSEEKQSQQEAVSQAAETEQGGTTVMQLIPALTTQLGISDSQASGGMGALLQTAKTTLSPSEFSTLGKAIPSVGGLLKAAPAAGEQQGMVGDLLKSAGKYSESAKLASQVASQFSALGLDAAMIPKFIDITKSFFTSNGNEAALGLFSKGIGALL